MAQPQSNIDPLLYELLDFKPRKGDIKKLEIIKASIECLASLGLEKTSYESIAKIIGTRRAHVAYHFSDKHEIFKAAIKFILATYQQISIEQIQLATSGRNMLRKYVEAAFIWAKTNPDQVKVILLLYYFCSLRDDYRELNDTVKRKGVERIYFILTDRFEKEIDPNTAKFLSQNIQSLTSQAILDFATTKNKSLDEAQENILKVIDTLIDSI